MIRPLALAAVLLLCACKTAPAPEPIVRTVEVKVPVPVKCRPALGAKPDFPDTDASIKAAPGAADRYQLMAVGRPLHFAWELELEAALRGCAG